MLPYLLSCLQFNDISDLFSKVTAYIFIVINIPKEAYSLRIFTLCIDKMLSFSNLSHLVFLVMSDRKDSFLQLPIIYLSKKISLIFHWIRTCCEPFTPVYPLCLCVMAGSYEVIGMSHLLIKGSKLNQSVTHYVWIRRKSSLNLRHCVVSYLLPIFLMTVYYLQITVKPTCNSRCHL